MIRRRYLVFALGALMLCTAHAAAAGQSAGGNSFSGSSSFGGSSGQGSSFRGWSFSGGWVEAKGSGLGWGAFYIGPTAYPPTTTGGVLGLGRPSPFGRPGFAVPGFSSGNDYYDQPRPKPLPVTPPKK